MPALHFSWCVYQAKKEPALPVVRNCVPARRNTRLLPSGQRLPVFVVISAVTLCQQLPRLPAATRPGETPVGARPSADRQLLIFLSRSVPTWSVILCTAGAGQLLSGTPEVVVCFQSCCDGQNLASPGRAAWAGCHVHPPLPPHPPP